MLYIDIRFDSHQGFLMDSLDDIQVIDKFLYQYGEIVKSLHCKEISWKKEKPHTHHRYTLDIDKKYITINRNLKIVPKAFSQAFKYYYAKELSKPLYNKGFMIKVLTEVKDTFYNYLLKDQEDLTDIRYTGFSYEEIKDMHIRALEARRLSKEAYDEKKLKKEKDDTKYENLREYLKENINYTKFYDEENGTCLHQAKLEIGKHLIVYRMEIEKGKIPTRNSVENITYRYLLQEGYVDAEKLINYII